MIDLHCHILPGIDDGPADLPGALELAGAAVADGTRTLAATPHLRADHPRVRPEELRARVARLQRALSDDGLALELVAGGEVDLMWAVQASDSDLRRASLRQRGRDLLVETPYGILPARFEDLLFNLTVRGYRVLLAHPERSITFQRDAGRLARLVERGVLLQVTAVSLTAAPRRSRHARLAAALVREGRAHVIASDAHGPHIARARLSAGVEAASRIAPLRATWMVTEAPAAILAGEPLPAPPPERATRWLRRHGPRG